MRDEVRELIIKALIKILNPLYETNTLKADDIVMFTFNEVYDFRVKYS